MELTPRESMDKLTACTFRLQKIISGGQTGADLGGLVAARRLGIATGGTAPKGFRTEKGPQVDALTSYGLVEHPSANYQARTRQNVQDADATLIIATAPDSDGTRLTMKFCDQYQKPYLVVHPDSDDAANVIQDFLSRVRPSILNIAGNRESLSPGLERKTANILEIALSAAVE